MLLWRSALPFVVQRADITVLSTIAARSMPLLVFSGSFVVYFFTLAPTVYGLDSAEFSAAAYNLGVPHATGYPLYLVIGKLFTYLPVGDVGYRLNFMSATFAAGAVAVAYCLALLVSRRAVVGLAVSGFLAFSFYFWASALTAEVYALHIFLTATAILLLLSWDRGGNNNLLYCAGFVWGLSFGNHLSTVLLAPAFAYLVAMAMLRGRLKWQPLTILAACFLSTLAVYAYLPLRYAAEAVPYVLGHYNDEGLLIRMDHTSFRGIWETLTARQFGVLFFPYGPLEYVAQVGRAGYWLFANFLGFGLVLGIVGVIRNYTSDPHRLTFLGLIFLSNLLFFAGYGALDKSAMFLPVYLVWSIWLAEGTGFVLDTLDTYHPKFPAGRLLGGVMRKLSRVPRAALVLIFPIVALSVNYSYTDLSSDTRSRDSAAMILADVEPGALVLAGWPDEAPMSYLQIVEKQRPDVQIIDRFLISPENERRLIERNLPLRAVYVFGPLPTLSSGYSTVPVSGGHEMGYRLLPLRRDGAD